MSQLQPLHAQLSRLRWLRLQLRFVIGLLALLALTGTLVGALGLLDFLLDLDRAQRLVAAVLCVVGLGWFTSRGVWPWLRQRESSIELALMVEQTHGLGNDLVAALQFEQPAFVAWGSADLKNIVMEQVALWCRIARCRLAFPWRKLLRNLAAAIAVVGLWLGVGWTFPDHLQTFLQRLALRASRYPTRTVVTRMHVNGSPVPLDVTELPELRVTRGGRVQIELECKGDIPTRGEVEIISVNDKKRTRIPIAPIAIRPDSERQFRGELEHLAEEVQLRCHLGDAITRPVRILVLDPPILAPHYRVVPPAYAGGIDASATDASGSLQLAALEGSRIELAISSSKPLRSASLRIVARDSPHPLEHPAADRESASSASFHMTSDAPADTWALQATDSSRQRFAVVDSPAALENLSHSLQYEITGVDEDGLAPVAPLRGEVRMTPDYPPVITGSVGSRRATPQATPTIAFVAKDDYGISRLQALVQIARQGIPPRKVLLPMTPIMAAQKNETGRAPIEVPAGRDRLPLKGDFTLTLAPLELHVGDRLSVVLQAMDQRGQFPGKIGQSVPLSIEIASSSQVLGDILEEDKRSAEQLGDIIRRQLETTPPQKP